MKKNPYTQWQILWLSAGIFAILSLLWAWTDSVKYQRTAFWRCTGSRSVVLMHRNGEIRMVWPDSAYLNGVSPGSVGVQSIELFSSNYWGGGGMWTFATGPRSERGTSLTPGLRLPYWLLVSGATAIALMLPWWWRRKWQTGNLQEGEAVHLA
ncbi:hypothetical protein [Haloferula sp. BvORR071]|uniref:hypothetical protein n=1 Tax=Haloferula sp. BvORR071 TaxID=1396141 RepID=UPI00054F8095|nr:hypothetical protein [Haloferula sp. BvORR071]